MRQIVIFGCLILNVCGYYRVVARVDRFLGLAEIAESQWGLVTAAQARSIGVNAQQLARLAQSGVLERRLHGVYRLAGVPYDRLVDLKAAWLSLEPGATAAQRVEHLDPTGVVSHRSAAQVHELGDLDADLNEFTLHTSRRTSRQDTRLYKRSLDTGDWTIVAGLPTTTVAVTITDLAAAATDGGHLGGVVRDAVLHGKIDFLTVAEVLRPYAHKYGAPLGAGRTLTKTLLAQSGLAQTISLAERYNSDNRDAMLTELLQATARDYLGAGALMHAVATTTAQAELLGAAGILNTTPTKRPTGQLLPPPDEHWS